MSHTPNRRRFLKYAVVGGGILAAAVLFPSLLSNSPKNNPPSPNVVESTSKFLANWPKFNLQYIVPAKLDDARQRIITAQLYNPNSSWEGYCKSSNWPEFSAPLIDNTPSQAQGNLILGGNSPNIVTGIEGESDREDYPTLIYRAIGTKKENFTVANTTVTEYINYKKVGEYVIANDEVVSRKIDLRPYDKRLTLSLEVSFHGSPDPRKYYGALLEPLILTSV